MLLQPAFHDCALKLIFLANLCYCLEPRFDALADLDFETYVELPSNLSHTGSVSYHGSRISVQGNLFKSLSSHVTLWKNSPVFGVQSSPASRVRK